MNAYPKLHNAMWPGLVGKGSPGAEPAIDLGVDYFQLSCGGFPELTTLELLMNEVLPALNGA